MRKVPFAHSERSISHEKRKTRFIDGDFIHVLPYKRANGSRLGETSPSDEVHAADGRRYVDVECGRYSCH